MKNLIISKTYSEITPESAENGDFSDTGFEWENSECTFRELVDYLKEHKQYCNPSWCSSGFSTIDYRTGTEQETCIHWSRNNPEFKRKYWVKAMKLAGVK